MSLKRRKYSRKKSLRRKYSRKKSLRKNLNGGAMTNGEKYMMERKKAIIEHFKLRVKKYENKQIPELIQDLKTFKPIKEEDKVLIGVLEYILEKRTRTVGLSSFLNVNSSKIHPRFVGYLDEYLSHSFHQ